MSIDSARSKALIIQRQVAQLQREKAREAAKITDLVKKASGLYQAASKMTTASTAEMKMREYHRCQEMIGTLHKKVADFDERIEQELRKIEGGQNSAARADEVLKPGRIEKFRPAEPASGLSINVPPRVIDADPIRRESRALFNQPARPREIVRVLYVGSSPQEQNSESLEGDVKTIVESMQRPEPGAALRFEAGATSSLASLLVGVGQYKPQIVHFRGRGPNEDSIAFQDDEGTTKPIMKDALVQALSVSCASTRLVIFNSSIPQNRISAMLEHVKAVIAIKSEIGEELSRRFSSHFYSALGFGKSLKDAFDHARTSVVLEGAAEDSVPILHTAEGTNVESMLFVGADTATSKIPALGAVGE